MNELLRSSAKTSNIEYRPKVAFYYRVNGTVERFTYDVRANFSSLLVEMKLTTID